MSAIKLSDADVLTILKSRSLGRPELCTGLIEAWLKSRVGLYTKNRSIHDDLVQDCLVYFLETVFRWIEPREIKAVRNSLNILMEKRILSELRRQRLRDKNVDLAPLSRTPECDPTEIYAREIIDRNTGTKERAILELAMQGYNVIEMAGILGISIRTIQRARASMVV